MEQQLLKGALLDAADANGIPAASSWAMAAQMTEALLTSR